MAVVERQPGTRPRDSISCGTGVMDPQPLPTTWREPSHVDSPDQARTWWRFRPGLPRTGQPPRRLGRGRRGGDGARGSGGCREPRLLGRMGTAGPSGESGESGWLGSHADDPSAPGGASGHRAGSPTSGRHVRACRPRPADPGLSTRPRRRSGCRGRRAHASCPGGAGSASLRAGHRGRPVRCTRGRPHGLSERSAPRRARRLRPYGRRAGRGLAPAPAAAAGHPAERATEQGNRS